MELSAPTVWSVSILLLSLVAFVLVGDTAGCDLAQNIFRDGGAVKIRVYGSLTLAESVFDSNDTIICVSESPLWTRAYGVTYA